MTALSSNMRAASSNQVCLPPFNLFTQDVTESAVQLTWFSSDSVAYHNLRIREIGSPSWTNYEEIQDVTFIINDLLACTQYEAQVQAICFNGEESVFTISTVFETEGCCEMPAFIEGTILSSTSLFLIWPESTDAISYTVEYKKSSETNWTQALVSFNELLLEDIEECTSYDVHVLTICESGLVSEFTQDYSFATPCGACTQLNYCSTGFKNSFSEWIEQVTFGDIDNISGSDPSGYGDYTGIYSTVVVQNSSYEIYLKPGYTFNYSEWFRAWIDYDQNGKFDADEEIFNAGMATPDPVLGEVVIPEDAAIGWTRMRVGMRFVGEPFACESEGNFSFGEYEDYCIYIEDDISPCDLGIEIALENVGFTTAAFTWSTLADALAYNIRYKKLEDSEWDYVSGIDTMIFIDELDECSDYVVEVRGVCPSDTSMYTSTLEFKTECSMVAVQEISGVDYLQLMPNPFYQQIMVEMELNRSMDLHLNLMNLQGQSIFRRQYLNLNTGRHSFEIDHLDNLAPGIYILALQNEDQRIVKKLIKAE
jgi:hypothetical protein